MNLDALTDIPVEIADAMRPKRGQKWNMSWDKVAEEKAGNRIALLTTRIMVMLAQRLNIEDVAEVLAVIAVKEGVGEDTTHIYGDYVKRLTAE